MSLRPCIECRNEVRPRQQALQCDDCGFWQHRICGTGIDQATYRLAMIRGRIDWLCVACSLSASDGSTPTLVHPVPGASTDSLSVPIMISRDGITPSTDALVVEFIYLSTYWFSCLTESPLCAPSKFDSSTPENCKGSSVKNIAHFKHESLATGRTTLRVKFQVGNSLKHALT